MSSYKRIPKSLVKKHTEPIRVTENFTGDQVGYYDHMDAQNMQRLQEKMKETEAMLLQELETKRDEFIQKAYQEGYEKVKQEIEQTIQEEHAQWLDKARTVYEEANQYHQQLWAEAETLKTTYAKEMQHQLVEVVIHCAEKIARQSLQEDPQKIVTMMEAILEEVTYENKKIFLRVHPKTRSSLLEKKLLPSSCVELLPDPTLTLVDVIVETEREQLDATLETQLKLLKETIRREMHA